MACGNVCLLLETSIYFQSINEVKSCKSQPSQVPVSHQRDDVHNVAVATTSHRWIMRGCPVRE